MVGLLAPDIGSRSTDQSGSSKSRSKRGRRAASKNCSDSGSYVMTLYQKKKMGENKRVSVKR